MSARRCAGARKSQGTHPVLGRCRWIVVTLLFAATVVPAWAHQQAAARHTTPTDGISIPNLSHGQMSVIADNRAAILDLAAQQVPTPRSSSISSRSR
jgi:hypothetical protein